MKGYELNIPGAASESRQADLAATIEHAKSRTRLPISGLRIPGIGGIWEWSDAQLLRFICEEIHNKGPHIADVALETNEDDHMAASVAEMLCVASAVVKQNLVLDQRPCVRELWGVARLWVLEPRETLTHLCLTLYGMRRALISKSRACYRNCRDQVGLAHALLIAERVVQRGGLETDLDQREQDDKLTPVQKWAWTVTTKVVRRYLAHESA